MLTGLASTRSAPAAAVLVAILTALLMWLPPVVFAQTQSTETLAVDWGQAQASEPPAAPTGLTAPSVTHDSVTLSWDDPGDDSVTGYQVLRRSRDGVEYGDWEGAAEFVAVVDDTGSAATSYTDSSVVRHTRYVYRVKAINSAGTSGQSNYVNVETPGVPAAPTGLTAPSVTHDSVTLGWDDPGDDSITGYRVLRRSRDGVEYGDWEGAAEFVAVVDDTGSAETSYTDSSVVRHTRYVYRVKAINSAGTSGQSNYVNVETPGVPAAPTGLTAPSVTHESVTLGWDDPEDDSITGYRVLRRSRDVVEYGDGEGAADFVAVVDDTGAAETSYTDSSVMPRTRYVYRVEAHNPAGLGERSTYLNVETPAPPAATQQTVPDKPSGLKVSAVEDDSVTFGWDDPEDASITKYQYRYRESSGGSWDPGWTDVPDSGASTTGHTTVKDLKSDTAYNFAVRAVNPADEGPESTIDATTLPDAGLTRVVVVPQDAPAEEPPVSSQQQALPAAPAGLLVNFNPGVDFRGGARLVLPVGNVRWDDPVDDSITKYEFRYKEADAANWLLDWTDAPSISVGFVPRYIRVVPTRYNTTVFEGTSYTFEVRAVNAAGSGPASSVTGTPVPMRPVFIAQSSRYEIAVFWYAANTHRPGSIDHFTWTATPADPDADPVGPTTISISSVSSEKNYGTFSLRGLAADTQYQISLVTHFSDGRSVSFDLGSHILIDRVGVLPSMRITTRTNSGLVAVFFPGIGGGNPDLVGLQYGHGPDRALSPRYVSHHGATNGHYIVRGVPAGGPYLFGLRLCEGAISAAYCTKPGVWRYAVLPLVDHPKPDQVEGARAESGDGEATLSWNNPDNPSIAKYQYTYGIGRHGGIYPFPEVSFIDMPASDSSTTSFTLTNLSNDTVYYIGVRAENPDGLRGQAAYDVVIPRAPIWSATMTVGTFDFAFGVISIDLRGFNNLNPGEPSGDFGELSSTTFSFAETEYRIKALQFRNTGGGPELVLVVDKPAQLTGSLNLVVGDTEYRLELSEWTPAKGGDSTYNEYIWSPVIMPTLNSGDAVTVSLKVGQRGRIRWPAAPANLVATPLNGQVTLNWDFAGYAPFSRTYFSRPDSSKVVENFQYRVSSDGGTTWQPDWTDVPAGDASTTSHTITGLQNGTKYALEVRARTHGLGDLDPFCPDPCAFTYGAVSHATGTPRPVPTAPENFAAVPDDRRVALSWDDPSDSSITKYQYRVSADDGTNWNPDWTDISGSGAATTSYTITPLDNGTEYTFEVRAVNPTGNGPASGDTATPNPVPAAPGSFNAAPDDRRVALSWDDPSDSSITKYQYRVSTDDGTNWNPDWTDISGSGAATTSYTITPLDNGTEYTFEVRAVNPTGNGPASGDTATPNPVPEAPGSFNAAPDDRRVTLSWDDPSDSSITKYQYRVSADDGTNWNPDWTDISGSGAATTSYTLTPLNNGTDYTFEVRAVNPVGNGAVSSETATPNPRPVAPANFEAAPANRQVTLNWDDPRDNSIAKYQYRVSADGGTSWTPNWTDVPSSGAGTTTHTLTPLDNGTEYTFEVRAVNPTGEGAVSSDTATPNPRPAAPANFNAASRDAGVSLNWDDPGDSSITKYQHRYRKTRETNWDPNWTDITGSGATTTSHTITLLDNGTSYTFEVRAVNPVDNGAGARAAATPWPLPSAPRNLNAAPDDRRVTLSWNNPNNASITKYQYRVSADGGTSWDPDWRDIPSSGASTTTYTVTPLDNGTEYTFEVRAVNPTGEGAVSSDTATPNPRPAAPGSFNAAPDDRRVALSWDDPSDSSITKYQYRVSADDGTNWNPDWTDISGSGAATTSYTITPLDNGTEYTFEVRAVNPTGNGPASGDTATPNPVPAAPGSFNAAPDDRRVALSWDDPSDSSITKYQYRVSTDDGTNWNPDWTDISGSGAATTSYTITPLDNGTEYTFEVRAVNPTGNGPASGDTATPNPVPAAPGSFNAAPDDRRVALSWDDPSDSSITKYQYRVSTDDGTNWNPDWTDISGSGAATTSYTITPLDNGTEYTFEVRAVNPTGNGPASGDTATPNPVPAAPGSFNAAPDDRRVTLSWDDPSDSSITKYQYRVSADDGTNWNPDWTDISGSGAATTSYTLTPLNNGTDYTFEVRAVNPVGNGAVSGDTATPNPRPDAPANFEAAPANGRVTLNWDDPSDSSITKYQYRVSTDDGTNWNPDWTDISGSGAATTSYTITPLDNGTEYTFEVRAVNPTGNGPASGDTATPNPVPEAPGSFNAAPDDRRVTLSWDDPSDSSITKYQYRVSADDGTNWNPDWTDISGSGAATTSYTLTPLNNGTDYTFEVRAVNPVGNGAVSSETATPNPRPVAPANFEAAPANRQVTLNWDDPRDNSIAKYQYRVSADGGTSWTPNWTDVPSSGAGTTTHTLTPLDNGTEYTFEVRAVNPTGEGAVSSDTATPNPRPAAPANFNAASRDAGVSLNWDDPGDSSITKYQHRYRKTRETNWDPNWTDITGSGATTTSHTITLLDNGTSYTFEVRAVNPVDNGAGARAAATPWPLPSAPRNLNAAPDDRRVTLSWNNPNNASITKYQYRVSADGGTSWDPDWRDIPSSGASTTTYTVTPLDNGTEYTFEVRAVNPTGEGAVSSDTATPNPRPAAPGSFNAAPDDRRVALSWDDPSDSSITKYQYRVSADDGTNWNPDWTDISGSGAATTSYTITPAGQRDGIHL